MKSLVDILRHVLQDCSTRCGANPVLDLRTIERRTKDEGDSFLTITLPSYAQGLERALETGRLSPALFPRFRFRKGTCCPRFLGGFMDRVFGPDGVLLADADPDCIFAIRQICLFVKKLKLPCSAQRERAAESAFSRCESELRAHVFDKRLLDFFSRVSAIVWSDLLSGVPYGNPYTEYVPKHGPGTTCESLRGNRKFDFPTWPSRLDAEFPLHEFAIGSIRNFDFDPTNYASARLVSARDETPVRVVFVPKTQKTPRVIAIEPVCMQYIQQAVASWLVPVIEHHGNYTKGHVNFSDQSVNARLALSSSLLGGHATLDMSEASDRVSSKLVWRMLASHPEFRKQVFACRSTRATLPSGITIPLRKFASMGSALCFPMESMVFFIAAITSKLLKAGNSVTPKSVKRCALGIYVYGDDICVPVDDAPDVCETLEAFALKVNAHKSFWNGKFRESCGMDAYNGVDVTPVYARRLLPVNTKDVQGIASAVSLANQLYLAGLWTACRAVREHVERLLGELPTVTIRAFRYFERAIEGRFAPGRESAGLGWVSFSNGESANGWDQDYQCFKSKRWVVTPVKRKDPLQDDSALLKCLMLIGNPLVSVDHLRVSVRYGNLALKRRWTLV